MPRKSDKGEIVNMYRIVIAAAATAAVFAAAPVFGQHSEHPAQHATTATETSAALRDLWMGHIFWVRNVALETFAGNSKAAAAAEQQVVANAQQIAASIEPFYGKAASDQLFGLLAKHYGAVKDYLTANVAGDKPKQDAAYNDLARNAADIARFLSGANPNLPYDTVNALLLAHGAHHVKQIQQLHAKEYAAEAETWAAMKKHMYAISDAIAVAIVKQFPAKFSTNA
jgi:hypothetical protein